MKFYIYLYILICLSCNSNDKYHIENNQLKAYVFNQSVIIDSIIPASTQRMFNCRTDSNITKEMYAAFKGNDVSYCLFFDYFTKTDFYSKITQPFKAKIANYILAHRSFFNDSIYTNPLNLVANDIDYAINLHEESLIHIASKKTLDSISAIMEKERNCDTSYNTTPNVCLYNQQQQYLQFITNNINKGNSFYFALLTKRRYKSKLEVIFIESKIDLKNNTVTLKILNPEFLGSNLYYKFECSL